MIPRTLRVVRINSRKPYHHTSLFSTTTTTPPPQSPPLDYFKKPWYRTDPPKFNCTACGKCCHSSWSGGGVIVNLKEAAVIAEDVGMEVSEFTTPLKEENVDDVDDMPSNFRQLKFIPSTTTDLSDNSIESTACVFLKGKLCSIHLVRPTQCRTYPFWSHKIKTRDSFDNEALRCEGVGLSSSPGLGADEITLNALIQQIDITENGMYTYSEAEEMLEEVEVDFEEVEEEFTSGDENDLNR